MELTFLQKNSISIKIHDLELTKSYKFELYHTN